MTAKMIKEAACTDALLQHPDPEQCREWIRSLPAHNYPLIASKLVTLASCLLKSSADTPTLFQCVDVLREPLYRAVRGLSAQCLKPSAAKRAQHAVEVQTILQLLHMDAACYQAMLGKVLGDSDGEPALGTFLHRAIAAQLYLQVLHYQLRLPIPGKEWVKLHKLFHLATQRKLNRFVLQDAALFPARSLSINNLYIVALLLGCARINKLQPNEMAHVCQSLQQWAPLVGISRQPSDHDANQLVVDLTSGAAPNFYQLYRATEKSVPCYLQVARLIQRLEELQQEESRRDPSLPHIAKTLNSKLISHLKSAWSEYIYREERVAVEVQVDVCVGLDSLYFYLCGGKDLKAFIGEKVSLSIVYEEHEDAEQFRRNRSKDIWSAFVFQPQGEVAFTGIPLEYHFQRHFPMTDDQKADPGHPFHRVQTLDRSAHGCRLEWPAGTGSGIDVGALVGVRTTDDYHWQVGMVAWVDRDADGVMRTGVRLLSTEAIPVAVDVPLHVAMNDNYTLGILLPAQEGFSDQVSLLVPPQVFTAGTAVAISQKGIEERAQLAEQQRRGSDYEQFACGFVVRKPVDVTRPVRQ